MKRILGMFAFLVFSQTQVFAADGSSGCGPGWYVFKENSLVSSTFRNTTNGFLAPTVTVGMTFGTSNCTRHSIVEDNKRSLYFLAHNRDAIASQLARGRGEHLDAFANTLGCSWQAQDVLTGAMRSHLGELYQSDLDSTELLLQTRSLIHQDRVLNKACS